ncbi:nucleoside triphosphate pyrophosphatase [Marinobacter nanhaiticus D15-8W]|uniref:dTTP/UTP pyrophosphatase n=1 Tax=Marinobacter nanhaiticus D15-8W TaxID=626887 RepID=N6VZM3_9GAMM|nr:Maf family protein [Marinobacter nanhaiticus]ENO13354.1 septum formation inhibitor Maf [Marinobacter nanhaiticus D15-8W]BES70722.1 nucleoside triphosphate pyrophosphatase [Marinobacter nanhaiticus D15-8W]
MRPVVLASASPRRRELLEQIGLSFTVAPVDIDETPLPDERPDHYVERLARQKAEAGLTRAADPNSLVIGSDTTVVCEDRIMAKPANEAEAADMLRLLSGRTHKVMTAVALAGEYGCYARLVITEVRFREIFEEEIKAYWQTGEPADKAGGYGIQGGGAVFVDGLWGSYSAVVGLPLQETAELFEEAGQPVWSVWLSSAEMSL